MAPTSDSDEGETNVHQKQQTRPRVERRSLSPTPDEEKARETADPQQGEPNSWADDVDDTMQLRGRSVTKTKKGTTTAATMAVDEETTATPNRLTAPEAENQDGWKTTRGRGKKKKGKPTRTDPNDPALMQEAIIGITVIGGSGTKATIEEGGAVRIHPPTVPRQPAMYGTQQSAPTPRPRSGQHATLASMNRFAPLQSTQEDGDNCPPPAHSAGQSPYKGNAFEQELIRAGHVVRENYINLEANHQRQQDEGTPEDVFLSNFRRNRQMIMDICRQKGLDKETTDTMLDHALTDLPLNCDAAAWEKFIMNHVPEGDVDREMCSRGAKRLGDDLSPQKGPTRPRTVDDDDWADQEEMDVEADDALLEDAEDDLEDGEIVEQTRKPPTPLGLKKFKAGDLLPKAMYLACKITPDGEVLVPENVINEASGEDARRQKEDMVMYDLKKAQSLYDIHLTATRLSVNELSPRILSAIADKMSAIVPCSKCHGRGHGQWGKLGKDGLMRCTTKNFAEVKGHRIDCPGIIDVVRIWAVANYTHPQNLPAETRATLKSYFVAPPIPPPPGLPARFKPVMERLRAEFSREHAEGPNGRKPETVDELKKV
ncbi:hypothetical protein HDU96_010725 [Phlyctochytrium bullatum]|nr:hypothetical protein HDU96_010725 [Phlyctochytrium bullatum]